MAQLALLTEGDLPSCMALTGRLRDNFPGLETEEALAAHEAITLKNIKRGTALCAKDGDTVVGILLFSPAHRLLSYLCVAPEYRRQGLASGMIRLALDSLGRNEPVSVSTFREGDPLGESARPLYLSLGFVPGELTEEFGHPNQIFTLPPLP